MQIIKFYSVNDEYGEFSNFANYPIVMARSHPSSVGTHTRATTKLISSNK